MSPAETPGSDTTSPARPAPAALPPRGSLPHAAPGVEPTAAPVAADAASHGVPATNGAAADTASNAAAAAAAAADRAGNPVRPGFAVLLRIREFRALWLADTVSVLGDQIMRVSLSLLVYSRTGSAAATALVYALTFLPTLVGGAALSGLADRFPRKTVMIVTDVARAVLFGTAAIPALSLPYVVTLLVVAVALGSAFRAAQSATLPDVLPGDTYVAGLAIRSISLQSAQLAGYAVGGVLAAAIGPRWGLVVDGATFVFSAVLIATRVQHRPTPPRTRAHPHALVDYGHSIAAGVSLIAGSPRLRILTGVALMSGFYVVPEGIAAPYAATLGGAQIATGILMASDPAGSALGAWLLMRFVSEARQLRWMGWLAICPGLVLMLCWLRPGLAASVVIWVVAGVLSVFQIPASVAFVRALPDSQRGQSLGLVTSGMLAAQGLGVLAGGLVATAFDAAVAVGAVGAAGALVATVLAWRWRALRRRDSARVFTTP